MEDEIIELVPGEDFEITEARALTIDEKEFIPLRFLQSGDYGGVADGTLVDPSGFNVNSRRYNLGDGNRLRPALITCPLSAKVMRLKTGRTVYIKDNFNKDRDGKPMPMEYLVVCCNGDLILLANFFAGESFYMRKGAYYDDIDYDHSYVKQLTDLWAKECFNFTN